MSSIQKTILIIDDQKSFRKIYRDSLENQGYTIIEAENGVAGLDTLKKSSHVDMVILDIAMPLKSGIEVLTEIRQSDKFSKLPVIVLSVFDERVRFYDEVMKLGVSAYVVKGRGTLDELVVHINTILGGGKSGWQPATVSHELP